MTKAIRIHALGGPDAMVMEDVEVPSPKSGEARIRQTAIGLNFIDVYYRTGLYSAPNGLPFTPGAEGAGVILELGPDVAGFRVGDRVAYVSTLGAYAEERTMPVDRLVKIPDGVSDDQAAAMMLKGMTAQYLLNRTYKVGPDTVLLFHAAAGGVGLIAGQWAKHLGATTIGTAGSPDKVELARQAGFDHVINYRTEDFVAGVREITGGQLCHVVYDSVGKDTYEGSLDCLRPLGMLVAFGQSSGAIPPFNLGILAQKGSLYVTRPTLFSYTSARSDLEATAQSLFDVVKSGAVKIEINQTYPLKDAARAHRDLESRQTTGVTILKP